MQIWDKSWYESYTLHNHHTNNNSPKSPSLREHKYTHKAEKFYYFSSRFLFFPSSLLLISFHSDSWQSFLRHAPSFLQGKKKEKGTLEYQRRNDARESIIYQMKSEVRPPFTPSPFQNSGIIIKTIFPHSFLSKEKNLCCRTGGLCSRRNEEKCASLFITTLVFIRTIYLAACSIAQKAVQCIDPTKLYWKLSHLSVKE